MVVYIYIDVRYPEKLATEVLENQVKVQVLWVSDFGIRNSEFGFRHSSFRFRAPAFGFRVAGFRFRVAGFGFQVLSFGFQDPNFGSGVSGTVVDFGLVHKIGSRENEMPRLPTQSCWWIQGVGFRVSEMSIGGFRGLGSGFQD